MATTTSSTAAISTDPAITSHLGRLRWAIRAYFCLQGLAMLIVALAIGFWISLTIDWLFELTRPVRIAILVVIGALVLAVAWRYIIRRWLVPLSDQNMAMLLERRHKQLDDRLVTVVELTKMRPEAAAFDPVMLRHTQQEALELVPKTGIRKVFNFGPLARSFLLAFVTVGSVVAFALLTKDSMNIWLDRSIMLGDRVWPRETKILVDGFDPDDGGRRVVKVARGANLKVVAKADTSLAIPDTLQIRYETQDGTTGRPFMTQLRKAVPGRDAYQQYEYVFKNIQSTIDFDVLALHGGPLAKNDRIRDLVIEAVDSPDLTDIQLSCEYPAYLKRSAEQLAVRVARPLPEGTSVTISAKSTKPLISARYRRTLDPDTPWQDIKLESADQFQLPLGPLSADTRIALELYDTDKVTNQQPIRLLIRIIADEVPRVDAFLAGISKAVTPIADLPIRGTIWDDHGISKAWFEYQIDADQPNDRSFEPPGDGELSDDVDLVFELLDLELTPGQTLLMGLKVEDSYSLDSKPHVGAGQRFQLQVVSESDLRAMLETRERLLRRRFESVIDEMNRTRDLLKRLDPASPAGEAEAEAAEAEAAEADEPEVADAPAEAAAPVSGRADSLRILRTEQALHSSQRMQNETREIAQEFERILLELENNNVTYIEQFEQRLGSEIAAPLRRVADVQFVVLDDRLKSLRRVLGDQQLRGPAALAARQQVDVILREMAVILANMLDLQEFNELLADLRKIIDAHKRVEKMTAEERERLKQKRKDELKKGLLD